MSSEPYYLQVPGTKQNVMLPKSVRIVRAAIDPYTKKAHLVPNHLTTFTFRPGSDAAVANAMNDETVVPTFLTLQVVGKNI